MPMRSTVEGMRILESSTIGKYGDPSLNEDGLFIGTHYLAVVDGVTSKAEYNLWHPSPGVVAKDLLTAKLRELDEGIRTDDRILTGANGNVNSTDGKDANRGLRMMQRELDDALRSAYASHPERPAEFFADHPNERLQANAVVYGVREHEIWLFGDCLAMVDGQQIPTMKKVDELLGEVRSFVATAFADGAQRHERRTQHDNHGESDPYAGITGVTDDPGRRAILPLLRVQSWYANRPGKYGYFVFDGFTLPDWPVKTIPVHQGDEVVLASDGYPYLHRTLAESEAALVDLHRDDPQLIHRFRSTKGFLPGSDAYDDRTYLRFIA